MNTDGSELVEKGRKSYEYASRNMKVLSMLLAELKDDNVIAGKKIGLCLHVTKETSVLAKGLLDLGADVYLCGSNPLSTKDEIAAYLNSAGVNTYARYGLSMQEYEENIGKVLRSGPQIIVDDGADMHVKYHKDPEFANCSNVYGGTEETTTGILRLKALDKEGLKYHALKVNDTPTKNMFDNRYGTGQSSLDGIFRSYGLLVAGKTVVVAGYGWVGKGVAKNARGIGAHVIVTETYGTELGKIRGIEAHLDGFEVMPMGKAIKSADIVFTATGDKDIVRKEHMLQAKDGCALANVGHFNVEIDVEWLEANAAKTGEVRPHTDKYTLPNGRDVYLIAKGRLANLVAAEGHPPEVMQMSFSNQLLSVDYLIRNKDRLQNGLHRVPKKIDDKVARTTLDVLGVELDVLTAEQRKYLKSWKL